VQSGQLLGDCCYTTGSVLLAPARKQFCQLSAQLLVAGLRRGPDVPLEEIAFDSTPIVGPNSGRMTDNPEVINLFFELVPTNALLSTNGVVPEWSATRKLRVRKNRCSQWVSLHPFEFELTRYRIMNQKELRGV
jgi:hypothetical protein